MKMEQDEKTLYEDNWSLFEKFLGYLRYLTVRKYILDEGKPVCADIGCGFNGRFLFSIAGKIKQGYGIDIRANEIEKGNIKIINNSNGGGVRTTAFTFYAPKLCSRVH